MKVSPDDSIRELARKTARSIVDHGSVPMATLKESIILQEKVDTLLNKPDVVIPEYPEIPEVDLSPIEEKIDEILAETKKKDLLEYDLQIDDKTRKKLKGDKGDTGLPGKDGVNGVDGKDGINGIDGKDGVEISPEEVVSKLESLKDEKRLSVKAIKGLDEIIKNIKETRVASGGVRLLTNLYDVVIASPTDGQGLVYDATTEKWVNGNVASSSSIVTTGASEPSSPVEGQLFINTTDNGYKVYYGGTWQTLHTLTAGTSSYWLQEDGTSFFLQEDGVSKFVLQ